jgi:hypothetical protein
MRQQQQAQLLYACVWISDFMQVWLAVMSLAIRHMSAQAMHAWPALVCCGAVLACAVLMTASAGMKGRGASLCGVCFQAAYPCWHHHV